MRYLLRFHFLGFISKKEKKLSKRLPKEMIKKKCQKLSKTAQKSEKLPKYVLLTGTLWCLLTQPIKNYFLHNTPLILQKRGLLI